MKSQKFTGFKGLNYHFGLGTPFAQTASNVRFNAEVGGVSDFGGFDAELSGNTPPASEEVFWMGDRWGTATQGGFCFVTGNPARIYYVNVSSWAYADIKDFKTGGNIDIDQDAIVKVLEDKLYVLDDGVLYRIENISETILGTSYSGWYAFKDVASSSLSDFLMTDYQPIEERRGKVIKYADGYFTKSAYTVERRDSNFRILEKWTSPKERQIGAIAYDNTNGHLLVVDDRAIYRLNGETLNIIDQDSGSEYDNVHSMDICGDWIVMVSVDQMDTVALSNFAAGDTQQENVNGYHALSTDDVNNFIWAMAQDDNNLYKYNLNQTTGAITANTSYAVTAGATVVDLQYYNNGTNDEIGLLYEDSSTSLFLSRNYAWSSSTSVFPAGSTSYGMQSVTYYNGGLYLFAQLWGGVAYIPTASITTQAVWMFNTMIGAQVVADTDNNVNKIGMFDYRFGFVFRDGQELMVNLGSPVYNGATGNKIKLLFHFGDTALDTFWGLLDKIKIYRGYNATIGVPVDEYYYLDVIDFDTATEVTAPATVPHGYRITYYDVTDPDDISAVTYSDATGLTRVDKVLIPTVKNFALYGERFFFGGLTDPEDSEYYGNFVYWTPERAFDLTYWLDNNQTRIQSSDTSNIHLMAEFRGQLGIVTESDIVTMNGFSQSGKRTIVAPASAIEFQDDLYILGSGLLKFDGYNFVNVGFPIFHRDQLVYNDSFSYDMYGCDLLNGIFLSKASGSWFYDIVSDSWSFLGDTIKASHNDYFVVEGDLRQFNDNVTYAIPTFSTKHINLGDSFAKKKILFITVQYKCNIDINVDLYCDDVLKAYSLNGTSGWEEETMGIQSGACKSFRLQFDTTTAPDEFDIASFTVYYEEIGFNAKGDN
jgi:hypothetical protein